MIYSLRACVVWLGLDGPLCIHSFIRALQTRCVIIDRHYNGNPYRSRRVLTGFYNGCVARVKGEPVCARWAEWSGCSPLQPPLPPLVPPAGRLRWQYACVYMRARVVGPTIDSNTHTKEVFGGKRHGGDGFMWQERYTLGSRYASVSSNVHLFGHAFLISVLAIPFI